MNSCRKRLSKNHNGQSADIFRILPSNGSVFLSPVASLTWGEPCFISCSKHPEVKSIILRREGAARGKRLIEAESLRRFLASREGN